MRVLKPQVLECGSLLPLWNSAIRLQKSMTSLRADYTRVPRRQRRRLYQRRAKPWKPATPFSFPFPSAVGATLVELNSPLTCQPSPVHLTLGTIIPRAYSVPENIQFPKYFIFLFPEPLSLTALI